MKRLLPFLLAISLLFVGLCGFGYAEEAPDETPIEVVLTPVPSTPSPEPLPLPTDAILEVFETLETFHATTKRMAPLSRYARNITVTEDDLTLAAKVAYFEAGGSDEDAYRAVLCVLYNRCVASRFGGGYTDIPTEVFRKGQFSVIHHDDFDTFTPPSEIVECARDIFVLGELSLPENILFFCAERLGEHWGGRKLYKNIGGNLFFYGSTD